MNLFHPKSRAISIIVFLAALIFYSAFLWSFKDDIPAITINSPSLSMFGLSILISAFIVGLGGFNWFLLLRDHKVSILPIAVVGMFMTSQFGKYLPGNIGQHVGRVILAQRAGISIPVIANTMIVEMVWGVANGCGLAFLSLLFFAEQKKIGLNYIPGEFELVLLASFLMALPWIGIHTANSCFPGLAKRLTKGGVIPFPKVSTAIIVSGISLLSFFLLGLILKIQAQWIFGVAEVDVFELTCLFAIAWLAGYLVPGAPGGLGVREAMMVLLLSHLLGAGVAVGLAFTLRVTTTLGDAVAFVLGILAPKDAN